jgi:hypothetical protein
LRHVKRYYEATLRLAEIRDAQIPGLPIVNASDQFPDLVEHVARVSST